MTDPIRVDMGQEDNSLGDALMEALLTGRPIVMFESGRPELGEVGFGLEVDQAVDDGLRLGAARVEEGGSVVAFDDGDRAAWLEVVLELGEGLVGIGQVLQDEADEDVVELLLREFEEVRVPPVDAGVRGDGGDPGLGLGQ